MSSDSRRDALQRYSMVVTEGFGKHLVQYATDPNGEWVRYADVAALRATPPTTKPSGASDETGAVALPDAVGFMLRGEVCWEPRLKPEDGALVYAYRREQK